MVQSANMLIAPALGAFLFAVLPIQWVIMLDVFGALLGTGMLLLVTIPRSPAQGEKVQVVADMLFGYRKLRHTRGLWAISVIGGGLYARLHASGEHVPVADNAVFSWHRGASRPDRSRLFGGDVGWWGGDWHVWQVAGPDEADFGGLSGARRDHRC